VHLFAQQTAGAAGTRPSLRPLGREGGAIKQSSGETRRENGKVCKLKMHAEAPSPTATIVMHDQGRQRLIDGSRWR
jgi:hypothetical protein